MANSGLKHRVEEWYALEERVRRGGGDAKIAKQHKDGKLTARERIAQLLDRGSLFLEVGSLVAHDHYQGQAPAAGVVTGVGRIEGRLAVVVANDATVKAGAWWPETIAKILRAQEIAMRNRLPIVYLVDSAGVNLPYQDGIFPGQYGAARIFYYNSLMRRTLRVPQIAAVMGPCIAGGAYLPALSDLIIMVDGTSFMGLGGPNLVKGATGQTVDAESLGGARMHTSVSGVAHLMAKDDADALRLIRARFTEMPAPDVRSVEVVQPRKPAADLYDLIPADHRLPYEVQEVIDRLVDGEGYEEFGGIIYAESARKVAYFVEHCERQGLPLLYLQDVSGFMVGAEAEMSGIIRAGAEMVETMACSTVPKIVLTINHASGAGYYAMAGQGFDPHFTFGWPTARIGVMEGDSAVMAVHGPEIEKFRSQGQSLPAELEERIQKTRADYERWLDSFHAASRGHVDALIDPLKTRALLDLAFAAATVNRHREHLILETL